MSVQYCKMLTQKRQRDNGVINTVERPTHSQYLSESLQNALSVCASIPSNCSLQSPKDGSQKLLDGWSDKASLCRLSENSLQQAGGIGFNPILLPYWLSLHTDKYIQRSFLPPDSARVQLELSLLVVRLLVKLRESELHR